MKKVQFLTVDEILDLLRISLPTLDRYVRLARLGKSSFPIPVQVGAKRKRLWRMEDIERWLNNRVPMPSENATATNQKQQRRAAKVAQERQVAVEQALADRHGIFINTKKVKSSES